jgi:3-hydroxyisobutyrate dehydrogenase-like beta-hydroxyacid dehydrogenase
VRPVLGTYCDAVLHVGGLGDGQRMKLVNNLVFTVNLRMAILAADLGDSLGIPLDALTSVLARCSGGSYASAVLQRTPPAAIGAGVRAFLMKDVSTIRDVAVQAGIDLGVLGELAEWVFE